MGTNCLFGEDQELLLSKFGLLEHFICECVYMYLKGT